MALSKLLTLLLDGIPAGALGTGPGVGVVGVATGSVPVTRHRLGVEGHGDVVHLSDAVEDVAAHPEVISHLDSNARTDLVLPLGRHDLGVHAADLDAGVQAGLVVGLNNVAGNSGTSSGRAVVWALWPGEAARGPAEGPLGAGVEEGVLLLNAEPGLIALSFLHDLSSRGAGVRWDGLHLSDGTIGVDTGRLVGIAHNDDVAKARAEGIPVDLAGDDVNLGVFSGGLAAGAPIVVPGGEVLGTGHFLGDGPGLAAKILAGAANPHVLDGDALLALVQSQKLAADAGVQESGDLALSAVARRESVLLVRHCGKET
mmetsp:Transcript_36331/g.102641  ORF Transcript_36331/g.102641 Transcript_36331/m.102641 type:complete len:314 (-) Transcript_36331:77-1018(-)